MATALILFPKIKGGTYYLVLDVKLNIRMAKSFGRTKGWGVLLFFFPFIVSLILGYGKAEYIGNTTTKTEYEGNT